MTDERNTNYTPKLATDGRIRIVCDVCGRSAVCGERVKHGSACPRRFDSKRRVAA